jgi:addiction module RelE/StbE family toxin
VATVEVLLTESAGREFDRLKREVQARFAVAIDHLRENPTRPRPGLDIRPMKGLKGMWRLRVGEYRGIYQRDERTITFTRFAHRSQVY